jgi:hypothetical protein
LSKTQLQTNNARLSALITELQGKAAGGGEEKITIESLAIGTEIYLMEAALTPYILIAKDHHGAGLVTLIRKYATAEYSPYHYDVPSSTSGNKYDGSTLEKAYDSFYEALPEETKSKIRLIDIDARASAGSSTVGKISARMFPLSEMEYVGTGSAEGSYIPYFARDEQRIAYDETGTPVIVWTRSVTGGMNNFCRIISAAGSTGNQTVPTAGYLRPACCIDSTVTVTKDGNGNYVLGGGSGGSGGGSVETCKVIIGGGGMLLAGIGGYAYMTIDGSGQIVSETSTLTAIVTPHEITCLANSIFWVKDNAGGGPGFPDMLQFTGCELVKHFAKDASLLVKLTCGAGETASIR